jgi:transposase
MARPLLPDELWEMIEPSLPPHRPHPKGGRPFLDDRRVLTGIVFVLKTGIPWEYLPQEMGCGSGMTCWRRLREAIEVTMTKTIVNNSAADTLSRFFPNAGVRTALVWGSFAGSSNEPSVGLNNTAASEFAMNATQPTTSPFCLWP